VKRHVDAAAAEIHAFSLKPQPLLKRRITLQLDFSTCS
jgi:hypothetical protein